MPNDPRVSDARPAPRLRCAWPVLAISLLWLPCPPTGAADAPSLLGRVARVVDGDTVVLALASGERVRLRLAEIDAPEMAQPHGVEARRALEALAASKPARAVVIDTDRYGRRVVDLFVGTMHVNAEMVRRGHAWAYTRYARGVRMIELEDESRAAARGLWSLPLAQRDAPWEWRERKRHSPRSPPRSSSPSSPSLPSQPGSCGEKTRCSEMVSCAEARRHLEECGLSRLDGDGDGVPCEKLCR